MQIQSMKPWGNFVLFEIAHIFMGVLVFHRSEALDAEVR